MANIASLSAYDGASPAVLHTFIPVSVSREKSKVTAEWREINPNVPAYAQPRVQVTLEMLKSGVHRCELSVVVPVMEAILNQNAAGYTAAPKVAFEDRFTTVSYHSNRSDITGRRRARQLAANLLLGYPTETPVVVSGPAPDLFDLLISPT